MAGFLLFVGLCFIATGITVWQIEGTSAALSFWVMGGITFIPGSYASVVLLRGLFYFVIDSKCRFFVTRDSRLPFFLWAM